MLRPAPLGLTLPQLTSWLPLNPRAQLWSLILSETIPGHSCPASRCLLTPSACLPVSLLPDLCPVRTGSSALACTCLPRGSNGAWSSRVLSHICWLKGRKKGGKKRQKKREKSRKGKGSGMWRGGWNRKREGEGESRRKRRKWGGGRKEAPETC